jgi:multidrug transporter EmrE-like cation transporter
MGTLLAIVSSVVTVVGNVYAKEWATAPGWRFFLGTQLFYLLGALIFPLALRFGTLTVMTAVAGVAAALATAGIGLWVYNEHLTTVQLAGVVISLVGIVLLTVPFRV